MPIPASRSPISDVGGPVGVGERRRSSGRDSGVSTGSSPSRRAAPPAAAVRGRRRRPGCSCSVELPTEALSSSGVPSATLRPRSITAIRSASWSASSRYCVVSRTVQPVGDQARGSCPTSGRGCAGRGRWSARRGRSAAAGVIRLAARSRRRRMPPENCAIGRSAASSRPNCSSSSPRGRRGLALEAGPAAGRTARGSRCAVRFSSTEAYCPVTPSSCRTLCGSRRRRRRRSRRAPPSIGSRVASICSMVVLPAPLGPRTPKISPWRTSRSMPSTARIPEVLPQPDRLHGAWWLSPYRRTPSRLVGFGEALGGRRIHGGYVVVSRGLGGCCRGLPVAKVCSGGRTAVLDECP